MLRDTFFYDPGFPARPWGIMLVFGFMAAIFVAGKLFKQRNLESDHAFNVTFWVFLASVIGARLFFVLPRLAAPGYDFSSPLRWIAVWDGGMVFYGGLLGGIIAVLFYAKLQKLQVRDILDAGSVGVVVGYALGRIGCFLNGCCYGTPTELPWGVVYPPTAPIWGETGLHLGTPVHPTQLYDSLISFLFLPVIIWIYRNKPKGAALLSYIAFYVVDRFLLEFLRGDNPHVFLDLTRIQLVTIGIAFALALQILAVAIGKRRQVNPDNVYFWGILLTPISGLIYSLSAPKWQPAQPPAISDSGKPKKSKREA